MRNRLDDRGFTIVELLAVIITSSIIMGVTTAFALNLWTNTAVVQSDEDTLVSRLNAGDYLRDAVDSASGLIDQNDLADAHTGDADPSDPSGTHWAVIHAVPGTINMGAAGTITPLIYFNRPSIDTSKNIIMNGDVPYQDDVILYMDGSTKQLLARVRANPYASNNRAKTSCPASQASQSCPADTVVADNVAGVGMRYFSRSGNTIDYTSIVDPNTGDYIGPDFSSVEVVEFTLNLYKRAQLHSGANTTNQTVIRVALRN
jgi:Tfp pilus assembly protein PilW